MKAAILYYSRTGTVKKIADRIAETVGADIFPIEPEKKYRSFAGSVLRYIRELKSGDIAAVTTESADLSDYDVLFLGFPVWASSMPNFMQAYIQCCTIPAKTVIPFVTAAGNGKEGALEAVKKLFPDAEIKNYFYSSKAQSADVGAWLDQVKATL